MNLSGGLGQANLEQAVFGFAFDLVDLDRLSAFDDDVELLRFTRLEQTERHNRGGHGHVRFDSGLDQQRNLWAVLVVGDERELFTNGSRRSERWYSTPAP